MKLKQYLGGFGAGVIVSASVLLVANAVTAKPEAKQEPSSSYISYTSEDTGSDLAKENKSTEAQITTEAETTTEVETTTEAVTEAPTEAVTEAPTEASPVAEVEIPAGTATKEVFNILYNAGVISDVADFSKYMYDSGYDTQIRIGTYTLTKGDSYENIAKILAHK